MGPTIRIRHWPSSLQVATHMGERGSTPLIPAPPPDSILLIGTIQHRPGPCGAPTPRHAVMRPCAEGHAAVRAWWLLSHPSFPSPTSELAFSLLPPLILAAGCRYWGPMLPCPAAAPVASQSRPGFGKKACANHLPLQRCPVLQSRSIAFVPCPTYSPTPLAARGVLLRRGCAWLAAGQLGYPSAQLLISGLTSPPAASAARR